MFKKSSITILLATFAFSSLVYANKLISYTPEKCPSIASIQAEGLEITYSDFLLKYVGQKKSNYDTNDSWGFVMGYFQASSFDEASKNSQDTLMKLSGNPKPTLIADSTSTWVCTYQTYTDQIAIALTGSNDNISNTIHRFLK